MMVGVIPQWGQPTLRRLGCVALIIFFAIPIMAQDRFVSHGDGTVSDSVNGLMWAATDNGFPINWPDALTYCQTFNAGGHSDWRMPTLTELATLYDPEEINARGYHINRRIQTSAASCWAFEIRGSQAARFNFTYGNVYWLRQSYSGPTRVLPVRRIN